MVIQNQCSTEFSLKCFKIILKLKNWSSKQSEKNITTISQIIKTTINAWTMIFPLNPTATLQYTFSMLSPTHFSYTFLWECFHYGSCSHLQQNHSGILLDWLNVTFHSIMDRFSFILDYIKEQFRRKFRTIPYCDSVS